MKRNTKLIIKTLFFIFGALAILSSCNAEKKYQKALNIVRGDTPKFRDACQEAFPSVPTEFIEGKTIVKFDTITETEYIECPEPTIDNPKPKVKIETKTIYETKTKTDTIKIQDQKIISKYITEIQSLERDREFWRNITDQKQNEIEKLKDENRDLSKKVTNKNWIIGSLFTLILLFVGFKLFIKK